MKFEKLETVYIPSLLVGQSLYIYSMADQEDHDIFSFFLFLTFVRKGKKSWRCHGIHVVTVRCWKRIFRFPGQILRVWISQYRPVVCLQTMAAID